MAKATDKYSRVYWRIVDDERFEAIYGNDAHLAAWLRLLLIADQAWPASANVPASVRRSSLTALVSCGLVESRPGGIYRVHGLDAERMRRSSVGDAGAAARWSDPTPDAMRSHTDRIPESTPDVMRSHTDPNARRDETSKDETSRDEQRQNGEDADAFSDYYALTIRYPKGRTEEWLRELVAEFGDRDVGRALGAEWGVARDIQTFLGRTEARLRADAHAAERSRSKPKARVVRSADEIAEAERQRKAILEEWSIVKGAEA